jgi:ferredoxin
MKAQILDSATGMGAGCTGHGRCMAAAPEVYQLDGDGYNRHRDTTIDIPPGKEAAARRGAQSCPERAIAIIEDE